MCDPVTNTFSCRATAGLPSLVDAGTWAQAATTSARAHATKREKDDERIMGRILLSLDCNVAGARGPRLRRRIVRRGRESKGTMLKGTGVSAGVAQGNGFVLSCGYRSAVPQRSIRAGDVDRERARLDAALARADAELLALQEDVREKLGAAQAEIFGAHRLILRDPS